MSHPIITKSLIHLKIQQLCLPLLNISTKDKRTLNRYYQQQIDKHTTI